MTVGGAGGTSVGARKAGLRPVLMVDYWEDAVKTYKHNFPTATVLHADVTEFCHRRERDDEFKVDCLHISPPCPEFSPANTSANKGEGKDFNVLFSVHTLVKKSRPRMITLEQTFGILHKRWEQVMAALIRMFSDLGYSVSWQQVYLQQYGLCQTRKRLIIIASWLVIIVKYVQNVDHKLAQERRFQRCLNLHIQNLVGTRNASTCRKQSLIGLLKQRDKLVGCRTTNLWNTDAVSISHGTRPV